MKVYRTLIQQGHNVKITENTERSLITDLTGYIAVQETVELSKDGTYLVATNKCKHCRKERVTDEGLYYIGQNSVTAPVRIVYAPKGAYIVVEEGKLVSIKKCPFCGADL